MAASRRVVLATLVAFLLSGPAAAETTRVTFLLVNDLYLMSEQQMADGQTRGGYARLAAVVKAERAKGGHVILAHGGDALSPSLMSGIDHGAHIIALSNLVPPDIFVPGNHEFDFGKATFLQRVAEAKFQFYAANLRDVNGQPLPGFKDRAIVTFDGVRIGLTGASYDDVARTSTPEDLQFAPTVATVKQQAEALAGEGADFTVAVVHADRRQDNELKAARAVDLLLSGHNHDLFINFDGRNAVVESSFNAIYVTAVDVTINVNERDGHRQMNWWPQFRVIDTATVTPDPDVAAIVAGYERQLNAEMDTPLAITAVGLDSRTVRTSESTMGNLVADAMRATMHADVAILNGGAVRGAKAYPPGTTITRRDILAELPFGNRLIAVEMSGADLKKSIENGISLLPDSGGRFPQVSGLVIEADIGKPVGSRVLSIKANGAPLDETHVYRVATNDFIGRGGDGYDQFRDAIHVLADGDSPVLADEVMLYLQTAGTVRTGLEGRFVVR